MLASLTRLRVRSVRFLPSFLWRTFLSRRQVERGTRLPRWKTSHRFRPHVLDFNRVAERRDHEKISRRWSSRPRNATTGGMVQRSSVRPLESTWRFDPDVAGCL